MTKIYRLNITIGQPLSQAEKIGGLVKVFSGVMIIPSINHFWLGGGWAIDLIGALFGFMIVVSYMMQVDKTSQRRFETADEAADWVREWEPKE